MLLGGAGDDLLDGGTDDRRVDYRRRPDTYSWADAPAGVVVDLSGATTPGIGTATGEGTDSVVLGTAHGVVGSAYADSLTGSPRPDRVYAGAGPDTISTGDGVDLVYPDGLDGHDGRDVVDTGAGSDLVSSLTGRDQISTGRGADFVEAFSPEPTAADLGPGDDYVGQNITPGNGADAQGGAGDDAIAFYGTLLAGQTPQPRFTVDYRTGVTTTTGDVPATGTIGGFEGHRLIGPLRWGFFGVDLPERVWAIQGGPLRARMAEGADQMTGTPGDDLLDGGAGPDTGQGRGGDGRLPQRGARRLLSVPRPPRGVSRLGREAAFAPRPPEATGNHHSGAELLEESRTAVVATSTAVSSGTSRTVTDWLPPAVVATRVVRPARRWNQELRRFQPMIASVASSSRLRVRLPERATSQPSTSAWPSERARSTPSPSPSSGGSTASPASQRRSVRNASTTGTSARAGRAAARGCSGGSGHAARGRSGACTGSGVPITSAATRSTSAPGVGGSSAELPDSLRSRPVTIALSRPPPTSRSPHGSPRATPRSRSSSRLVSRVVSSPRRTCQDPSGMVWLSAKLPFATR